MAIWLTDLFIMLSYHAILFMFGFVVDCNDGAKFLPLGFQGGRDGMLIDEKFFYLLKSHHVVFVFVLN